MSRSRIKHLLPNRCQPNPTAAIPTKHTRYPLHLPQLRTTIRSPHQMPSKECNHTANIYCKHQRMNGCWWGMQGWTVLRQGKKCCQCGRFVPTVPSPSQHAEKNTFTRNVDQFIDWDDGIGETRINLFQLRRV